MNSQAINAIAIFGTGFGELLLPPDDSALCARWKTLPQSKDYLAAIMQVINDLRSIRETPSEGEPLQLADGIYWHTPDRCFAACHCTGQQICDRVQVLYPTNLWAWGQKLRSPADLDHPEGALIFGHSIRWPLRWGNTALEQPVLEADNGNQVAASNDSGIEVTSAASAFQAGSSMNLSSGSEGPASQGTAIIGGNSVSTAAQGPRRLRELLGKIRLPLSKTRRNPQGES